MDIDIGELGGGVAGPAGTAGAGRARSASPQGETETADPADRLVSFAELVELDDSALLRWRAQARAELERLPPTSERHATLATLYDNSTSEVDARAREAWAAGSSTHPVAPASTNPPETTDMSTNEEKAQ